MRHNLGIERSGAGFRAKQTPICSCGWVGIGYEAHNDYQYTLVAEQQKQHLDTELQKLEGKYSKRKTKMKEIKERLDFLESQRDHI